MIESYRILLATSSRKTNKYIIYDGPFFKLDVLQSVGRNKYISSTFLCILELLRDYPKDNDLFTNEQYFNYSAILHSEYTTIMIEESDGMLLDLPFNKCAKSTCVLNVTAPLNYY